MLEKFKEGLTPYTAGLVQALGDAAIITGELVRTTAFDGHSGSLVFSKVYNNIVDRFLEVCDNTVSSWLYQPATEVWEEEVNDEGKRAKYLTKATMGYVEGMCQALRRVADIQDERTAHIANKELTIAITVLAKELTAENNRGMPFNGGNYEEAYLTGWAEAYNHAAWKLMGLEDLKA